MNLHGVVKGKLQIALQPVLARISGGSFEGLMDATFAFARALADVA
ncbi:MAG: hypothetical protein M3R51_09975 [Candidatus Eremiobacteraeota bacterium]|nr:hypothetical protein [Candidatus Eremiobacteraeota bacterium]